VRTARSLVIAAVLGAAVVGTSDRAEASGLYFSERGVRPLARGGAFVAGADDIGAIWHNPAGLADAGTTILVDLAWLNYSASFTRKTNVTDAGGTVRTYEYPTVNGSTPILPIPTMGLSYAFGEKKQFTLAGGMLAPYTAIQSWPSTIPCTAPQTGQCPSPSRYSLISLDGSLLLGPGLYFAWKPIEQLRLGIGLEALVGTFQSQVMFTASPADRLLSAPEDPQYDTLGMLKVGPIFAPSANIGATVVPIPQLRFGVSGQLPYWVNAPGHVQTKLPTAAPFDNARQEGDSVWVKFRLPAVFRIGMEVRPVPQLRIEGAYVAEFWSLHDSIDVVPTNLTLVGVTGFPSPFPVGRITLQRNFQNASSFRLGGEYQLQLKGYGFDFRLGGNFDQSAIPRNYLSPLTVDLDRFTVALGVGLHIGDHWRFDATYARVIGADADVDPASASIQRVNPVHGYPTKVEAINGGHYWAGANVLGVGLQYKFSP